MGRSRILAGACALCCWMVGATAHGDWRRPVDESIVTDRPGNGNAAATVTRGHFNLEAGALYAHPSEGRVHQLSFPTWVRLGVLDWLEARVSSALVGYARTGQTSQVEPTDTALGVKLGAGEQRGVRPDLAFSADLFLPSGDGPFTAGSALPEMRALVAWGLPQGFGLLLNAGADIPREVGGRRYARALYVVNLGYAPPALEGRLSAFVEAYGLHGLERGREQVVQVDWGLAALLRDDLQIDFFLQHGVSTAAPDLQVSVGISARL